MVAFILKLLIFFPPSLEKLSLCVPGQIVEKSLQFLAYNADHAALHSIVGHVDEKDEGWRLRKLVVLLVGRYNHVLDASKPVPSECN